MPKLEIKKVDVDFYRRLKSFLPEKIIDVHTHIWRKKDYPLQKKQDPRFVSWPSRVAEENTAEDLIQIYRLLLPENHVTPIIFPNLPTKKNLDKINCFVSECSKKTGWPALIFSDPGWSPEELEEKIIKGGFIGAKSYMSMIPDVPLNQISIFDYFPEQHLEIHNKNGWIVMLHIPKDDRLKNPENLKNLLLIDEKYLNIQLIVAHVGRAYCDDDAGNAFQILKRTKRIFFDISANTNENIFYQLIDCAGPERILFGSDMPITTMRMKRVTKNGTYVNLVPEGLYGDVSQDRHMEEVRGTESEKLSFFLYEEIDAFRKAAERYGLSKQDIEKIFYKNALKMIGKAKRSKR
ncbi:MAG: amidohydrolase [Candidatus Omnitrophica bacterium]|nr:amidohydrolase [Candidatus Omnitrophota bacterium]MCM8828456.1 amidohydrolase [Candidatus Omnitrophota bacterium]